MIISIITILLLTLLLSGLYMLFNLRVFGKRPSGERKSRIEQSPYYQNGQFVNEDPVEMFSSDHDTSMAQTMWKFLKGQIFHSGRLKPKAGEIPVIHTRLQPRSAGGDLPDEGDLIVWFGHSSFMLRLNGKVILVDPVFVEASPVFFINRPFKGTDYYKPQMMPETIDYLVISHDHYDHLDCKTVRRLRQRVQKVICPLGIGADLEYWGYKTEQIIELDCNHTFTSDIRFVCLPTQHFSGRGLFDRMQTQRASWLIDSGSRKIFYSGDGGYNKRFEQFGTAYPDIDLAIMENGQYNQAWAAIHTLPDQLAQEVQDLHPQRFMTVHHSKYALALHDWDEPRKNEQTAAQLTRIPLLTLQIGEVKPL